MLNKAQKETIVKDLADKFKRQKIAIFTDFQGISVTKSQTLRRMLKKLDAEYKVAKKTLLDRALALAGINNTETKKLQGEIGVAFGYEDEVSPAKTLLKFSKNNETFKLLGGLLSGRVLNEKDVVTLAKLPAREVLLGNLVGTLQSPLQKLVMVLGGNLRNLAIVFNKIKDKK